MLNKQRQKQLNGCLVSFKENKSEHQLITLSYLRNGINYYADPDYRCSREQSIRRFRCSRHFCGTPALRFRRTLKTGTEGCFVRKVESRPIRAATINKIINIWVKHSMANMVSFCRRKRYCKVA
jgi:hypothetical protein